MFWHPKKQRKGVDVHVAVEAQVQAYIIIICNRLGMYRYSRISPADEMPVTYTGGSPGPSLP